MIQLCYRACTVIALLTGPHTVHASRADSLAGQSGSGGSRPGTAKVQAIAISTPVRLDGRLDELFWAVADSIENFRQREPDAGAPASERTVVKIVRDANALYVGVRAGDRDPSQTRASQLRRDSDLESDDNVALLIDGLHDLRSAFVFQTNPRGAMWDAQVTGTSEPDANWNGIWEVATSMDDSGWTAEYRIPFRTLRYQPSTDLSFGFNVRRFIRHKNEEDLWTSFGRTEGFYQLQNAGTLGGLGGLRRGRDLEVRPYALGRAIESEHDIGGGQLHPAKSDVKVGIDTKLAASPTLTADLTVNTDFAEVEADQQVINLTRFPLQFPEKREFFLESNGLYGFGSQSLATLFYSRRIGLLDDQIVPILAGARLYGRLGPWSVGLLEARTGDPENANDAVVRLKHDVLERSSIGVIGTIRSVAGAPSAERAAGVDLDFPLVVRGQNLEPFVWLASTQRPLVAGSPVAWRVGIDYPNDLWDNFVSVARVQSGFSPPLGFVNRDGVLVSTGHVNFMPRPHALGIRQLDVEFPIPSWSIYANEHGSLGRSADWQTAEFEWRPLGGVMGSGDRFEANVQRFLDAPTEPFDIFPGVMVAQGSYWWTRGELWYETSSGRSLSAFALVSWGGFYGGRSIVTSLSSTWRPGGHLILTLGLDRSAVKLPEGHFDAVTANARIEYAFSTRAGLLAFVQHGNEAERADFNVRFHWIPVIGDEVFLVWNSSYTTASNARFRFPETQALSRPLNGAIILKAVHRLAL